MAMMVSGPSGVLMGPHTLVSGSPGEPGDVNS
jgi:hypothetical protein